MKTMKLAVIIFVCLMLNTKTEAQNGSFNLKQPDGTTFSVKEMGLCWLRWYETPEGYMIQKGKDKYYHYVTINEDGEIVQLPQKAGKDRAESVPVRPYENPAIRTGIVEKVQAYNRAADENRVRFLQRQRNALGQIKGNKSSLNKLNQLANPLTIEVGVILVEFNDLTHYTGGGGGYTVADFETMLFSDDSYISPSVSSPNGEDVFGSLRDYFEFQSHGILTVNGHVVNPTNPNGTPKWINLGVTVNSYPVYAGVAPHYTLYRDAINAAIDSSWNVNQDMHIIILAGSDGDGPYDTWGGTGFHRGYFTRAQFDASFYNNFDNNWYGAAGYHERNSAGEGGNVTFSHIGIFAHEAFHVMGWGIPNVDSSGTGIWYHPNGSANDWSLMYTGTRTGPLRKGECPGDIDPVAKIMMEWAEPTVVTGIMENDSIEYIEKDDDTNETLDFYRLEDPYSTEEFIVENRQFSGFNSYLPEWWQTGTHGGILFWRHYSATSQTRSLRPGDNDFDINSVPPDAHWAGGDAGDPFPGESNNTAITPYTTPSTNREYSGNFTGFAITDISTSATTMTANFYTNYWSGTITTNTTWTSANSPYYIGDDLTVNSGVTLTIEAGTAVNAASGVKLTINGTLDVKGLFTNTVTFDRSGGSDWGGIVINSSSGSSSSIKFATIINAGTGLDINGASPTITSTKINNCGTGVRIQSGAAPKFAGNTITYNDNNGVYCLSGATPSFGYFPTWGDNVIRRNGDRGVYAAYSCTVFLGQTTTPPSGGRNSIYENYNTNGYQISIRYGSTAMAENNWWGSSSPSSSIFQDTWTIDYIPSWPGSSDPHSSRPLTGAIHAGTETSPTADGKEQSEADSLRQQLWQTFILYQKAKYDSAMQISRDIIKLAPASDAAFSALNVLRISHAASGKTGLESYLAQLIAKHAGEEIAGVARLNLAWYALGQDNATDALAKLQDNIASFSDSAIERITLFQKMVVYLLNLQDRKAAEAAFAELQTKYPNDQLVVEAQRLLGKSTPQKQQKQPQQQTTLNAAELHRNSTALSSYPNPFNPETRIQYQIPEASLIQLRIYNLRGQEIRTLVQERQNSGTYSVVWDGKNGSGIEVSSGLYIYQVTVQPNSPDSRPFQQNGKMVLVR